MTQRWIEAGGEHQMPFFNAGGRILEGKQADCPKCDNVPLRYYFHMMNKSRNTGTLWIWCANCHITSHLSRVSPRGLRYKDPYVELGLEEFAKMELDPHENLLDRLDCLWNQNLLQE
jgi:hypothetical protein